MQCAHNKDASKHTCQKQQLEQDIVDIINHYKEIIVEIYSKINEILNKKEISYDLEIIKNKIQNAEEKKEKINELNRLLIDELIEDIVVSEDGNIKVIFKYEDKYFEAPDFINKQKYDIILSS